jgi:hypothetical protein
MADRKEQAKRYRERRKAKGLPAIRGKKRTREGLLQELVRLAESNQPWPEPLEKYRLAGELLLALLARNNKPWPKELEKYRGVNGAGGAATPGV